MNLKNLFLVLLLNITCLGLFSQSNKVKEADKLFQDFAYMDAIDLYQEAVRAGETSSYIYRQLAQANRLVGNTKQSEHWYGMLVNTGTDDPMDYYYYAMALRSNKKEDEAKKWIEKFKELEKPDDSRVKRELEVVENRKKVMVADSNWASIHHLSINTEFNDFSPCYYDDKVVFASSRKKSEMLDMFYVWDEQPFIDLYTADIGLENQLLNVTPFSEEINSKYHEGPVTFNKATATVYFTRNNYKNKKLFRSSDKTTHLCIYSAMQVGEEWGNVQEFKYNSKEYSCGHPALTKNGKRMYFVSDMPGGFGEADIYYCEMVDGDWSEPVNMGAQFNTEGNEMFPFVDNEDRLYFASNGLVGFGGLDVFMARPDSLGEFTIINLGHPLNGSKDDFGFVMNAKNTAGYISSNRKGGKGHDDIYSFKVIEEEWDNDDNLAEAEKDSTETVASPDVLVFDGQEVKVGETIVLKNIYYDLDKYFIRTDAARDLNKVIRFMIMYPNSEIELSSHTDCRASHEYNMTLSHNRAKAAVEYITTIGGIDPKRFVTKGSGETKLVNECADGVDCTEEQHQMNRRTEVKILKK